MLFVDDGSTDSTVAVLQQIRNGPEDCVQILRCDCNRGKAEAVPFGFRYALSELQQEIAGYWDVDLATPLESISRFLTVLDSRESLEMVFGARVKLLGRCVERRAIRHYLGRLFATVASQMLSLPIYDTQCGAKLFPVRPTTSQIFAEPFLSRWIFDVEIIARFLNLYGNDPKYLEQIIYEYPLETWVDVPGSKILPKDFFKALDDLIRIKRKYLS